MKAEQLWHRFIEKYLEHTGKAYEAWSYGVDPDELAALTLDGTKTATASGYELYEIDNDPLPEEGGFNIILDGEGQAVCITQTKKVFVTPFKDITERQAYKEGEGDRTLAYWRKVHIDFFEEAYQEAGLPFSEESRVVCEEFERVFPEVDNDHTV